MTDLRKEDYEQEKVTIPGVEIYPLKTLQDDSGSFTEVLRLFEQKVSYVNGLTGTASEDRLLRFWTQEDRDKKRLPANLRFEPRQMNYSVVEPGAIKGFHIHKEQTDLWFVPPGNKLLVGLFDPEQIKDEEWEEVDIDARTIYSGSMKVGPSMRFTLSGALLRIPPGVAHGLANLTNTPQTLIYFVDRVFNIDNHDEYRLPYDYLGKEFWERKHD